MEFTGGNSLKTGSGTGRESTFCTSQMLEATSLLTKGRYRAITCTNRCKVMCTNGRASNQGSNEPEEVLWNLL